jgi:hypothetical protein
MVNPENQRWLKIEQVIRNGTTFLGIFHLINDFFRLFSLNGFIVGIFETREHFFGFFARTRPLMVLCHITVLVQNLPLQYLKRNQNSSHHLGGAFSMLDGVLV